MSGSLRVGRRGATSKIGFDHVGEDDARLGDVEACEGRIHLVETLATAQKLGVDRTDLVEHLLQLAKIAKKLGNLIVARIRHVAKSWSLAGSADCGQISLRAVPRSVDAMAVRPTAALVGLDQ
jgi:hypothetical protein